MLYSLNPYICSFDNSIYTITPIALSFFSSLKVHITLIHTFAFQKCPLYLWANRIRYSFLKEYWGAFSVRCPDPQQLSAAVAGGFFCSTISHSMVRCPVGRACLWQTHPTQTHLFCPHWLPGRFVSGGSFFLGIEFALVKQLVGVDIGFTPRLTIAPTDFGDLCQWGFSFPPLQSCPSFDKAHFVVVFWNQFELLLSLVT
jgi:hypothetical protein